MKTSKFDGWAARRRNQREADRIARGLGFPNESERRHSERVSILRDVLRNVRHPADSDLFTTREVAEAIYGLPKVIREAAYRGLIGPRPSDKTRKLFLKGADVRQFVDGYRIFAFPELNSQVFRSEKIALNPHAARGEAVPMKLAMIALNCTRQGVKYYLERGDIKKIPCGRTVLVTRASLARLSWRRLHDAQRKFDVAKKKLEKIMSAGFSGKVCRIQCDYRLVPASSGDSSSAKKTSTNVLFYVALHR
jgi:hypothetical protein